MQGCAAFGTIVYKWDYVLFGIEKCPGQHRQRFCYLFLKFLQLLRYLYLLKDNPLNLAMMMKKISSKIMMAALVTGISFLGCKKSESNAKPNLKLKSVNTYNVGPKGYLQIVLECDNLSSIASNVDSAMGVKFIVTNKAPCVGDPGDTKRTKTFKMKIPQSGSFSGTSEIEINWLNGTANTGLPPGYGGLFANTCRPIDSTIMKFWVKNKAGVVSDTVTIDRPIVITY